MSADSKKMEIFTYNKTETIMLDVNGDEIEDNYDVNYSEQHTLTCLSQYGRPRPKFTSVDIFYFPPVRYRNLHQLSFLGGSLAALNLPTMTRSGSMRGLG